jgi:O-methyltransferase involved in polyketide biosynthesis
VAPNGEQHGRNADIGAGRQPRLSPASLGFRPGVTASSQGSDSISPTAEYTGYVWTKNGLSHPALATRTGRVLFDSMRPTVALSRAVGGVTLEGFLLARHRLIDHLLENAIEAGRVSQVLEIACGMSPRGWRFARRYGERLTYVEADLPAMAARKREALGRAGSLGPHHRVEEIDALADDGAMSLPALAASLDSGGGLAIVTEGLIHYLDPAGLAGLWRRIAGTFAAFPHGMYLSDVHLESEAGGRRADAFRLALSVFVRGRVHPHFADVPEAQAALAEAGFAASTLHSPLDFADRFEVDERGARLVRVIEAST